MKKLILILLLPLLFFTACAVEPSSDEPPKPQLGYTVTDSYLDISKKFHHCEIVLDSIALTLSDEELKDKMFALAKKEVCGEVTFGLTKGGLKSRLSESYAQKHPEEFTNLIGGVNRDKRTYWYNEAFLEKYNIKRIPKE